MALDPLEAGAIVIELAQQGTTQFHVGHGGQPPTGPGLGRERAPLGAAHTEEAAGAVAAAEQLDPNPTDHPSHRKTQQVNRLPWGKAAGNALIELACHGLQGPKAQAVGEVGDQQGGPPASQGGFKAPKEAGRIPDAMDQHQGNGRGQGRASRGWGGQGRPAAGPWSTSTRPHREDPAGPPRTGAPIMPGFPQG